MRKPEQVEALYVDFDSFFATAEQHFEPRLRGRPVGVIPLDTVDTGLIAASREAKAHGVGRGLSVRDARRVCPDIELVAARHEKYVDLHRQIVAAVETVLPVGAVRSIDELVCQLDPRERARAVRVAEEIKAALGRRIGPVLTCSIGLGPNELLAKIAAEIKKPDGLMTITPGDLPGPLLRLALTDIPGIADRLAARLARARIVDVAGLWALGPKQARAIWGSVEGERLWAGLHGFAVAPPPTRRAMFGHGRVLPREWRTLDRAFACARLLTVKAARRMRAENFAATTLTCWMTDRRSAGWAGEERFPPAWDDRSLLASLTKVFACARAGEAPERPRSVHVALHGLVSQDRLMGDLFDSTPERRSRKRFEVISGLADRINARYGRTVVHLGPWVDLPGGYAGAKIAFGRIPDQGEFDRPATRSVPSFRRRPTSPPAASRT